MPIAPPPHRYRRRAAAALAALAVALAGCAAPPGGKRTHAAPGVYPALAPYSQIVEAGGHVYLAGVIALDPDGKALVGATTEEQTRVVLEYIGAKLRSRGLDFRHVVNVTVFLADLDDFAAMNRVYATYFPSDPPARTTVEASRLPRDARIEIAVVAVR